MTNRIEEAWDAFATKACRGWPEQQVAAVEPFFMAGMISLFRLLEAAGIGPESHQADIAAELVSLYTDLGKVLDANRLQPDHWPHAHSTNPTRQTSR